MIIWLDFLIFGGGRGLAFKTDNDTYYWLRDDNKRHATPMFYKWDGWYGSQLTSFEWHAPKVGDQRKLIGYDFIPTHYHRRWFRYQISWATHIPSVVGANEYIQSIRNKLARCEFCNP